MLKSKAPLKSRKLVINRCPTLNDKAWDLLFAKHNVLEGIKKEGYFKINAKDINEFREARLMTKFDNGDNLPWIFHTNAYAYELSILPDSRGSYVIGEFQTYQTLDFGKVADLKSVAIQSADVLESLDYNDLYSESSAILAAFNTGILADLLGVDRASLRLTVNGRMSTKDFNFKIKLKSSEQISFQVTKSQCEIDAGLESGDKFLIIEAKNYLAKDFLIRQLYYPYRLWKSKIKKDIIPVFMCYSNDIFTFFVYKFDIEDDYNSISLVNSSQYTFKSVIIELSDIQEIQNIVEILPEPRDCPFPQADSFERARDLLNYIYVNEFMYKDEMITNFSLTPRQFDYYVSALRYLQLITLRKVQIDNKRHIICELTKLGTKIIKANKREEYLLLIRQILSFGIFNEILEGGMRCGDISKVDIPKIITKYYQNKLTAATIVRRSRTVRSWINWILEVPEKFEFDDVD
ncbi:MAG: hypothetical protein H7230_02350 [Candidatus Parcubacteria bacterium]|nr:hypothetical protein [Candidatus Paceibacterota bacterium]